MADIRSETSAVRHLRLLLIKAGLSNEEADQFITKISGELSTGIVQLDDMRSKYVEELIQSLARRHPASTAMQGDLKSALIGVASSLVATTLWEVGKGVSASLSNGQPSLKVATTGINVMSYSPNPCVRRLTLTDSGTERLKADFTEHEEPLAVTIYWRGRVDHDRMLHFMGHSSPHVATSAFRALVFCADRKLIVESFFSASSIRAAVPQDARFVRVEHVTQNPALQKFSDFMIWSRVDLDGTPPKEPAPDYIGISGQLSWIDYISGSLGIFLSETHVEHIGRSVSRPCLILT